MNTILSVLILFCFFATTGCQQKSGDDHGHDHTTAEGLENSENQALYDQAIKIHDEVMPKMDDLYKAKVALKTRLTNTPNMTEREKNEINDKIVKLDSVSEAMMVWMREFQPVPDSLGEKTKAYLENEIKKVQKVKEDILQALDTTN